MKTILIVEAGVNHNGNIDLAKKLIDKAKSVGAKYIKFQYYNTEKMITPTAMKATYQKKNSLKNENQYKMLKKLSLGKKDIIKLNNYCKKKRIKFLLSVFDEDSYDFVKKLKLEYIKIPSGEINNIPLLTKISKTKKKIILSTGASNIKEIKRALEILRYKKNNNRITLLHCVSLYPTPLNKINLGSIIYLKNKFNINVGLSDHTKNLDVPLYAITMGAQVIEKHFTLNKDFNGPDHRASINPKELKILIRNIKKLELMIGIDKKERLICKEEEKIKKVIRKSIYAKKNIKKGEIFTKTNIITKRPDLGISSSRWFDILGKKSRSNFNINEKIK